jgi:hypothetical protein
VRWRSDGIQQLIAALQPTGQYSLKRDLDRDQGRYLVLVAFENEQDANTFARSLGAETIANYPTYASQRGFSFGAGRVRKTLSAAVKKADYGKRLVAVR